MSQFRDFMGVIWDSNTYPVAATDNPELFRVTISGFDDPDTAMYRYAYAVDTPVLTPVAAPAPSISDRMRDATRPADLNIYGDPASPWAGQIVGYKYWDTSSDETFGMWSDTYTVFGYGEWVQQNRIAQSGNFFSDLAKSLTPLAVGLGLGAGVGGLTTAQATGNVATGNPVTENLDKAGLADLLGAAAVGAAVIGGASATSGLTPLGGGVIPEETVLAETGLATASPTLPSLTTMTLADLVPAGAESLVPASVANTTVGGAVAGLAEKIYAGTGKQSPDAPLVVDNNAAPSLVSSPFFIPVVAGFSLLLVALFLPRKGF